MRSSYKQIQFDYAPIFQTLCFLINPKLVVEFGILDGYSLDQFCRYTSKNCRIQAYDIFEDFVGNHANYKECIDKYKENLNVEIKKADFYKSISLFEDNSIDILHIDIANTGEIIPSVQLYLEKIRVGGIIILEGGSEDRDTIDWMKKYNKLPLRPSLKGLIGVEFITIGTIPSITLIKKQ